LAGGDRPRDDERAPRPDTPGWYPDPWSATGAGERYWDGTRWLTTERPIERAHGGTVVELTPRRRRWWRARTALWVILGALIAGAVVIFGVSQSSSNSSRPAVTAPAAVGGATTTFAVDGESTTSTSFGGKTCYGKDCGKALLGDWLRIATGDCMNTDETDSSVTFTVVSCESTHEVEVFYVSPPTIPKPTPTSLDDLTRAVCPSSAMQAYAPSFAADHPDPAAYAGGWSGTDKRVCVVGATDPNASIRG
jgi:hypothetical protein